MHAGIIIYIYYSLDRGNREREMGLGVVNNKHHQVISAIHSAIIRASWAKVVE